MKNLNFNEVERKFKTSNLKKFDSAQKLKVSDIQKNKILLSLKLQGDLR